MPSSFCGVVAYHRRWRN